MWCSLYVQTVCAFTPFRAQLPLSLTGTPAGCVHYVSRFLCYLLFVTYWWSDLELWYHLEYSLVMLALLGHLWCMLMTQCDQYVGWTACTVVPCQLLVWLPQNTCVYRCRKSVLSAETIVSEWGWHSCSGPLCSRSWTLYWIDRASVSAEEHMPSLFRICTSYVEPPRLSTTSVIRLCRGR